MKENKMKVIIIGIICIVIVTVGIMLFGFLEKQKNMREIERYSANQVHSEKKYEENEVICSASSEEEAKEIAEKAGGTLKSFQDGVAVIGIEQSVDEFLKEIKGRKDLPVMSPNYIYTTD